MEFTAEELIAPFFDSVLGPGFLATAVVMTLVLVSGLGAKAIEWSELIDRRSTSPVGGGDPTRRQPRPKGGTSTSSSAR